MTPREDPAVARRACGADEVPEPRRVPAADVARALADARSVVLCTHVNADGDGSGSEAALAHALVGRGALVTIANPTPFPEAYSFLLPAGARVLMPGPEAVEAMRRAERQVVVDTSEPARLGELEPFLERDRAVLIDHHAMGQRRIEAHWSLIDPDACATAELVHDVFVAGGWELDLGPAAALYVGIVTDTGSFRFANATPRAHELAAHYIDLGVNPEAMYGRIYGTVSDRQLNILRATLAHLKRDPEYPFTWIRLPLEVTEKYGDLDDWEPILESARSLKGTKVAVFLRELGDGKVKLSLRSNGDLDVAKVAHALGGGGHEKAAGAELTGSLDEVSARVREELIRAWRRT